METHVRCYGRIMRSITVIGLALGVVACQRPSAAATVAAQGAPQVHCVPTEVEPMPPPPAGVIIERVFTPPAYRAQQAELIVVGTAVALGPIEIDEARSDSVGTRNPREGTTTYEPRYVYQRDVTIRPTLTIKGDPGSADVTVRISSYEHEATFALCERALIFLRREPSAGPGSPYLVADGAAGKLTIGPGDTVLGDSPEHGPPVPLEDYLRFVRSAVALRPPEYPRDPAALETAMRTCPPRELPERDRPQRIEIGKLPGQVLSFGPDAIRGPELFRLVGELLLGAEPNPLDLAPSLVARMNVEGMDELAVHFGSERTVPGGGSYPTSHLRLVSYENFSGAPAIFNPSAPAGTPPLTVRSLCGYKALQELRTVRGSLAYAEGSGIVLQLRDQELTLVSAEDGVLVGRLSDATQVQNQIPNRGWPPPMIDTPRGPMAPPPLIFVNPTPVPMQAGHPVRYAGHPDPYQPRTVQLQSVSYGMSGATERARVATEDERRAIPVVEHRGQLYVAELAAPAEIAPYLAATGERIGGGRTSYGAGAEVFRLAGPSTDDVIVLRLPGSPDERLAANRRLRRFPFVAAADAYAPDPERGPFAVRLAPGEVPYVLAPSYRSHPPDHWHIEYRGGVYRPGEPVTPAAGELELVERIRPEARPGQFSGEVGMVEVYRWRNRPLNEEVLVNVVLRTQLGEYEIWRRWDPSLTRPQIPRELLPPGAPDFTVPAPLIPPDFRPPGLLPPAPEPTE
jgi:hypothetical protein